ncbi:nucleotidyltransferase [Ruminococcaceae bacterium OttesenSCG-928-L11]|nr:nucleotidyltransferase [Ruminococcaceae bacterium OttesenSCG-928-L11]
MMAKKPILVIMAAGMGSRYGGLKQIAPVDDEGHIIMDYSIYDARKAGFEKVVCIIKPELEADFREKIGDRAARKMDVHYAYQQMDKLPEGFSIPPGREKPWGTAHAVLCAAELLDAPFLVLNADDYYGAEAFRLMHQFLLERCDEGNHGLLGYRIENTLTENGHVARGVCEVVDGKLAAVRERTQIEVRPGGAAYTEDGKHYTFIPAGTTVSMNMWGFHHTILQRFAEGFAPFLRDNVPSNPMKSEYLLPSVVHDILQSGQGTVHVLDTAEKWYGVTYADDMPAVRDAIAAMKRDGKYPTLLWE